MSEVATKVVVGSRFEEEVCQRRSNACKKEAPPRGLGEEKRDRGRVTDSILHRHIEKLMDALSSSLSRATACVISPKR